MLLYEYPSKQERAAERRELALMTARRKKLGMKSLLIYLSSVAIIAVGVTADGLAAKIAICTLGIIAAAMHFVTSAYLSSWLEREHTAITDEGFVHYTKSMLGKRRRYDIKFDQIENTQQSSLGDLVISLKNGDTEIVPFRVTKSKLFLIKNMSGQMKYAAKEYNEIEDDETEGKDWVDRL